MASEMLVEILYGIFLKLFKAAGYTPFASFPYIVILENKCDGWSFSNYFVTLRPSQGQTSPKVIVEQKTLGIDNMEVPCGPRTAELFNPKFPEFFFFFFFFFFGHNCGMQKFPGQGSNLCHISNPGHCGDDTRSLICLPTWELQP